VVQPDGSWAEREVVEHNGLGGDRGDR
jgi:hypothetical protein